MNIFKKIILITLIVLPLTAMAADIDTDGDGLSDEQEISKYHLNPYTADTDGDGFEDNVELRNGYSPHFSAGKKITDVDQDNDGLSDGLEFAFGSDLKNPDTDGDSFSDGLEIQNAYDPSNAGAVKLEKHLEVYLSRQRLAYFLGRVKLGEFIISSGKSSTPTPKGEWVIEKKQDKAWSKLAGLWMPYWMSFNGVYAIHELPEWPDGTKEGADHLGIPVSHGCIRLSVDFAKWLYDWTPVGTKLVVKQ